MPCRYDGPTDYEIQSANLNKITQLLCEATKHLAANKLIGNTSEGLQAWYKEHKAADEKRDRIGRALLAREALKKKALSKLSKEELKALGLTWVHTKNNN